jgi:hypothetical protein
MHLIKTKGLHFINATKTAALMHRKSVSARITQDSCTVEESDKINTAANITTSILFTL